MLGGAVVTQSRSYAPSVPDVKRFGRFAVVSTKLRAVIDEVLAGERVATTPSPASLVPGFSARYEPAFDVGSAPADVRDAAARLASRRSSPSSPTTTRMNDWVYPSR